MGAAKVRNGKDLTGAEEIRKRWQEYRWELHRKGLNDLNDHNGVVTHLESEILESEVKWTLGSITSNKTSGGDGIPAELLKNPKRWCCYSAALNMSANLENLAMATGMENVGFLSSPEEEQYRRMFKLLYHCPHFTC